MYDELKGKRLLVLGGNRISCEIIKTAKKMGLVVGVCDYYPLEQSPGKQIADEAYDISTTDVDSVVSLIKKQHFEGLVTGFVDMLLPYYAEICDKARIPAYGTKEQFDTLINKTKYKSLCREFNVPTVEEYEIDTDDSQIQYPVIVKPADSSGSRGLSICESRKELNIAIEKALTFSKEKKILIERYMIGREVTVNWLFVNGEYYLTSIANRHVKNCQTEGILPLPVGYTYPAAITKQYRTTIEENAKRMFKHLGIKNGMMFMQCKVEGNTCFVYDIGYRLTGTLEYINYSNVCGFNPMEMLINFAITGKMCDKNKIQAIKPEEMKASFNVSILAKPGTIAQITGIEKVKSFPEVIDVVIAHYPGETITEEMKGLLSQITVRVFGSVNHKEQLYKTMKKVENTIRIISTEGVLMNLPGIEQHDIEGFVL